MFDYLHPPKISPYSSSTDVFQCLSYVYDEIKHDHHDVCLSLPFYPSISSGKRFMTWEEKSLIEAPDLQMDGWIGHDYGDDHVTDDMWEDDDIIWCYNKMMMEDDGVKIRKVRKTPQDKKKNRKKTRGFSENNREGRGWEGRKESSDKKVKQRVMMIMMVHGFKEGVEEERHHKHHLISRWLSHAAVIVIPVPVVLNIIIHNNNTNIWRKEKKGREKGFFLWPLLSNSHWQEDKNSGQLEGMRERGDSSHRECCPDMTTWDKQNK